MNKLKQNIIYIMTIGLAACNGGGSSTTSTQPQVFLAAFSANAYQQCAVNASTGVFDCANTPIESSIFNMPTGVAINNNYLYINNSAFDPDRPSDSSVVQCQLNSSQAPTNCQLNTPTGSGALNHPIGITIHNNLAYIANYGDGESNPTYTQCSINALNGNVDNCQTITLDNTQNGTPEVIAFNDNNYAYVTDQINDGYYTCQVNSSSANLTACNFSKLSESSSAIKAVGPRGVMLNNGYAYFVNSSYHGGSQVESAVSSYTRCTIGSNGSLGDCNTAQLEGLSSPTDIVYYNGYVYISNEAGQGYRVIPNVA